ncbi:MAG: hypothetical protein CMQ14_05060 [Gammaproteobacteria bacterium]|nr:hypothetical protein [Gammaproteobacteria bacterium]
MSVTASVFPQQGGKALHLIAFLTGQTPCHLGTKMGFCELNAPLLGANKSLKKLIARGVTSV